METNDNIPFNYANSFLARHVNRIKNYKLMNIQLLF